MSDLPSFLTQTGPSAYTLTMSASGAEKKMRCSALFAWAYVTGIEAATPRAGQNYGKALHLALEHRYGHMNRPLAQIEEETAAIMEAHFAANPQPATDSRGRPEWRTAARVMQNFRAYNAAYPAEDFDVLGVEEPFDVELGEFDFDNRRENGSLHPTGTVTVRIRGIMDLNVLWHDQLWVTDHKYSTEWSDLKVDEGRASFQLMEYAWVRREIARILRESKVLT